MSRNLLCSAAAVAILIASGANVRGQEPVSFKRHIAPLLLDHCVACHGPKKAEGSWRVDSVERLMQPGDSATAPIAPGNADTSEFLRRLTTTDPAERMPFDSEPLPPEQIELVKQWIAQGASFEEADPKKPLLVVAATPVHPKAPDAYRAALPVTAIAVRPDGQELVVSGYNEATVWNVADGSLVRRLGDLPQRIYSLTFSPDGTTLAVAGGVPGRLGEVRLVDYGTGSLKRVVSTAADVVFDAAWSPDGQRLATTAADGVVRVYATVDGAEQLVMPSHSDWVLAVAWNADGTKLATASRDKTAKAYDATSGELLATFSGHAAAVRGVAFSADGNEVYSIGSDNKLQRWAIADSAKKFEFPLGAEGYKLTRDGDFLFAATAEKKVRQWKIDGTSIREFVGATDWQLSAAVHAPTKRVIGGGFDGEIKVWNLDDAAPVAAFLGSPGVKKN